MISGRHLAVKINSDSRVVIKDLETTNGTYLNGNKIQESFMYTEDFVQIGKVKITIDDSEMTAKELGLHKRDFERTSVTFVRLGAQVEGLEEVEEDEFGQSKQKTLLAKIRRKSELEGTKTATTSDNDLSGEDENHTVTKIDKPAPKVEKLGDSEPTNEKSPEPEIEKKSKKKGKKKAATKEEDDSGNGLFGKIKGLFKK